MTTNTPEALRLAEALDQQFPNGTAKGYLDGEAAALLRHQHEQIERQASELAALRGPIRTGHAIDWRHSAAEIEAQYRAMSIEFEERRSDLAQALKDRDAARRDLANEQAKGVHSCGADCSRDACVNRRLRAELEEARRDAERYRWLRDTDSHEVGSICFMFEEDGGVNPNMIDARIDAAIKAQETSNEH